MGIVGTIGFTPHGRGNPDPTRKHVLEPTIGDVLLAVKAAPACPVDSRSLI